MARSSCFSIDDGKEYYTFREISSPDFFWDHTSVRNMCCRCRVFTFSFQAFFFLHCVEPFSTASEHAITTSRYMTSIFSVSHPSSCRVGKCQSRGVLDMSVTVFRTLEKCFVLRFLGSPKVSFDHARMLSHEQYCGECFFVESFFKHSVTRSFQPSLFGAKIVGWELDPGSCVEMGSEAIVVFCLHVCLAASECCGVCFCGRLWW